MRHMTVANMLCSDFCVVDAWFSATVPAWAELVFGEDPFQSHDG